MELRPLSYIVLTAVSAALFLGFHLGFGEAAARAGRLVLAVGWLVQLGDIGIRCFRAAPALVGLRGHGLHRLAAGGRVPGGVGALPPGCGGGLRRAGGAGAADPGAGGAGREPPAPLGSPLGTVHIFLATLGVATFALAAVLAVVYLLQERRLKRKRLTSCRRERPAGHPGSAGGPLRVGRLSHLHPDHRHRRGVDRPPGAAAQRGAVRPEYLLTLVAWAVLGVLMLARVMVGWSGRRAAWLTLGGFSVVMLVMVGYFLRHTV